VSPESHPAGSDWARRRVEVYRGRDARRAVAFTQNFVLCNPGREWSHHHLIARQLWIRDVVVFNVYPARRGAVGRPARRDQRDDALAVYWKGRVLLVSVL